MPNKQWLEWNGKKAYPGDTVEIPAGTKIDAYCTIQNKGGASGDTAFRIDIISGGNLFRYATPLDAGHGFDYSKDNAFTMPDKGIQIKFRTCHYNGEVDCCADFGDTAIFTLNVAKEPKACFLAVDNYFDNVPSSLEIVVGDEVKIGSGSYNCGEAEGNIHTTSYVDGALCADAFESLPVGTANDIARDPDTYSVKASCATFDMPDRAVKVDRYGEHWDGSKWVEDFHISFMLMPTTVAELRPKGFIYSYFPNSNDEKAIGTSVDVSFSVLNDGKVRGRIKGIVKKNGDDFITLEETIDTGTENRISTTKSFIMPDANVTLDYSVQHYDDETEMWVTDLTHYVITLSPEKEIEPPQLSTFLPDPRWRVVDAITKLYMPCHARSLKSDKCYYVRILCGAREVAHLELIEFGRLHQFQDIYIDKATVDRWCTPLPFTIDMVLLEGSTEVDRIQRVISAIPVEMSKSEFVTKIVGGIDTAALPSAPPAAGGWFRPTSSFAVYSGTCEGKTLMIAIMLNPFGGCTGNNPPTESDCILFNYNGINYDYGVDGSIPYECGLKALSELPTVKPSFEVTVTNTKPETCLLCHHLERFLLEWIPKEVCWRRITTDGQVETFTADDGLIPGDEYSFTCGHVMTGGCIQYPPISRLWETFEGEKKVDVVCPTVETPWAYLICRHFGVSDEECNAWILSWVLDPIFLAEEIMIVKEGKNLAGEPVEATKLDLALIAVATLGIASPGFSEAAVLKHFKELIQIAKGSDEFAVLAKTEHVANYLATAPYSQIEIFTARVRGGFFDDALKLLDDIPDITPKNAKWSVKRYDKWFELLEEAFGKEKAAATFAKHGITGKVKNVVREVAKEPLQKANIGRWVLVWLAFELPMMVGMCLMFLGKWPGSTSKRGNTILYTLSTDSKLCYNAIYIEQWDAARKGCVLFEEHLNDYETFLADNKETLEREQTYDILYGSYEGYKGLLDLYKIQAGVITWPEEFTAMGRNAVDGDTIDIDYRVNANGNAIDYEMEGEVRRVRVRIVGINTPETRDKKGDIVCTTTTPAAFRVEEKWPDKATKLMTDIVNQKVTIRTDLDYVYGTKGRLLAVVLLNGKDMGLEEIKQGLACYYFRDPHDKVDDAVYLAAETAAKEAAIGIWSLPLPDTGKIHCLSSPSTAEIWLGTAIGNEENTGYTTPKTLDEIAVGDYIVTFKAPLKCEKDAERCALNQCSKRVTVLKDETTDTDCVLCAIYEIRQPYYCEGRACAENMEKTKMDAEIFLDGKETKEWARGDRTIIKFGTDIDGNAFTLGSWHRECNLGKHTIELRRNDHKTIKITKNFKKGEYYGDDMEYEMPEGKPEEVVVPTPTPVPGEPVVPPVVEMTGTLHIGHAFDGDEQISTGKNKFPLHVMIGGSKCDCRSYIDEDLVFGVDKFCDRKSTPKLCPLPLGMHTFVVERNGYHDFEFTVTINAGDDIDAPIINMIPKAAALSGATDMKESTIPAEIYLDMAAPFEIAVKNSGSLSASYQTRVEFYGVDTDNFYSFESEWSEEITPGDVTKTPVQVTLPAEAIPAGKAEAEYTISTVLKAM